MKVQGFEDLKVWQEAMALCDAVHTLFLNSKLSSDFALREQLNRSSISIPSNIAEGFERDSNKSFVYFLSIAKGSVAEVRTQLELCRRRAYLSDETFQELNERCISISKMLKGLMNYLEKNPNPSTTVKEPLEEIYNLNTINIEPPNSNNPAPTTYNLKPAT